MELVIITEFGDQSVPVLKEILLRKGAKQELAVLQNVPMALRLYHSRLTRAQLKERVIASLGSLEMIGLACYPSVLAVAQNENEPAQTRQLALRHFQRHGGGSVKDALRRLQNDPAVATDATRALHSIQRREQQQKEANEHHQIMREMETRHGNADAPLSTRTSLWDNGGSGWELKFQ